MRHSKRTTMETFSGGWFDFAAMDPADIKLPDIAQALALTCRFGGQIPYFYSVAQHAMLVAHLTEHVYKRPDLALPALHHDSHEAYVGDVPTPLKNTFGPAYDSLVRRLDNCIAFALGLSSKDFEEEAIHKADRLALFIEASVLKSSQGIGEAWGNESVPPEAAVYRRQVTAHVHPRDVAASFRQIDAALRIRTGMVKSHA